MPDLSAVAGILDIYGGLRFVVTPLEGFNAHVREDELLFVVPDFWVTEPVEWDFIPVLIGRIERFVQEWIRTRNDPEVLNLQSVKMYKLRCLEHPHYKRATDLYAIAET